MENFIHDKYGYCFYAIDGDKKPLIFNLYTEPEFRGRGYARKHVQYVISEIREAGYSGEIEIEVDPRENAVGTEGLISFYRNMGLKIVGT